MSLDSNQFQEKSFSKSKRGSVYKSKFSIQSERIKYINIYTGFWACENNSYPEDPSLNINEYSHVSLEVINPYGLYFSFEELERYFPNFLKKLSPYYKGGEFINAPVDLVEEFLISIGYKSSSSSKEKTLKPSIVSEVSIKKGSDKMSSTLNNALVSLKNQSLSDVNEVVYRKVSKKLILLVRNLLVKALSSNVDSSTLSNVNMFLNTEYGEATLSLLVGTSAPYIPNVNDNEKFMKLAEEMRIHGMEILLDVLISGVVTPLVTPVLNDLNNIDLKEISE